MTRLLGVVCREAKKDKEKNEEGARDPFIQIGPAFSSLLSLN